MFKRILVPVDGSDISAHALAAALRLARGNQGRVRLVHQFDGLDHLSGFEHGTESLARAHDNARAIVDAGVAAARAAGVPADGQLLDVPGQGLGDVVAAAARAFDADLVVVGTFGRNGASRLLLGSGAEQVLRLAPSPVLVIRPAARGPAIRPALDLAQGPERGSAQDAASIPVQESAMFKRILVPVDGSDTSTKALVTALQLARESGGRVRMLHVIDDLVYLPGYDYGGEVLRIAREQAERVLKDAMDVAGSSGVPADARLVDLPGRRLGDVVAEEALAWEADLVVTGTHGRRGLGRVLLGSGAEQVIRLAPVPVLSVRGGDAAAAA